MENAAGVNSSSNSRGREAANLPTAPPIAAAPVIPSFPTGRETDAFFLTSITSKQRNCLELLESHWHAAQASFAQGLGINLPSVCNNVDDQVDDTNIGKPPNQQSLRDSMRAFDNEWAKLNSYSEEAPANSGIFYQGIEATASFGGVEDDCVHESEQYSNHINSCFGFDRARLYADAVSKHGRLKLGGTRRGLKAVGSSRLPAVQYYGNSDLAPDQQQVDIEETLVRWAGSENIKSRPIRLSQHGIILHAVPHENAIFQAFILFNGWIIDNVNVRGSDEQVMLPLQQQTDLNLIWELSEYVIFQQISSQARSAALRFFYVGHPQTGIRSFFHWLASFATLWSKPCRACNKIMLNGYPPCYRDCRPPHDAYHENCKAN